MIITGPGSPRRLSDNSTDRRSVIYFAVQVQVGCRSPSLAILAKSHHELLVSTPLRGYYFPMDLR